MEKKKYAKFEFEEISQKKNLRKNVKLVLNFKKKLKEEVNFKIWDECQNLLAYLRLVWKIFKIWLKIIKKWKERIMKEDWEEKRNKKNKWKRKMEGNRKEEEKEEC